MLSSCKWDNRKCKWGNKKCKWDNRKCKWDNRKCKWDNRKFRHTLLSFMNLNIANIHSKRPSWKYRAFYSRWKRCTQVSARLSCTTSSSLMSSRLLGYSWYKIPTCCRSTTPVQARRPLPKWPVWWQLGGLPSSLMSSPITIGDWCWSMPCMSNGTSSFPRSRQNA